MLVVFVVQMVGLLSNTRLNLTLFSNASLEKGLVGNWTFDADELLLTSVSAEVRDRSSSEKHCNWQNHASTTVPGPLGQATQFDGVNDSVAVGNLGVNVQTVAFWVKADAQNEQPFVAVNGATANVGISSVEVGTQGTVLLPTGADAVFDATTPTSSICKRTTNLLLK